MKRKSAILLLGFLCAACPALFASHHNDSLNREEHELDTLYPTLVKRHPHELLAIDFDFLNTLTQEYADLSFEESNTKDLTHNETLVPLARHWSALFTQHASAQGTFFAQEIENHLSENLVSLDWISLLPIRFSAAISSAPSQEEIDIYNQDIYDNKLSHTLLFEKNCWGTHDSFKKSVDVVDYFKNLILFRPVKKTSSQMIPRILLPILNQNHLSLPDIVLMNLDHIFPIGISFQSHTQGVHGTTTMTSLGFLLHDLFHSEISHSSFAQEIEEAPATVRSFLIKKHTLSTNMMKFFFRQKLQEAGGNFKDSCFRKTVLSLFLGNHESDAWPQELYLTTALSNTIEIFCTNILEKSQQFQLDTFEEAYKEDVAGTCVFDGKSYLSQEELFKRLRQHHLQIPEVHYFTLKDIPGDFTLTKENPYKIEYRATLDNKDLLSDFNTHRHIFVSESYVDTLYYRLRDAQGSHAFLRYAGLKGLKPVTVENLLAGRRIEDLSIDDMKASSAEAITYLHALAHSAIQMINDFQTQALALLTTPDADFLHIHAAKLSKELEQLEDIASVNTA